MDSMHPTSSKARNPVTHLQNAAITSAIASSQVVQWYLPRQKVVVLAQIESLHFEGSFLYYRYY